MGVFAANMFDATVSVSQGANVSAPSTAADDQALGYVVYFWQTAEGRITQIEYDSADSAYYVNVKLAAINALQTHLPGGSVLVSDPTGTHYANFVALSETTV